MANESWIFAPWFRSTARQALDADQVRVVGPWTYQGQVMAKAIQRACPGMAVNFLLFAVDGDRQAANGGSFGLRHLLELPPRTDDAVGTPAGFSCPYIGPSPNVQMDHSSSGPSLKTL